MRHEFQAKMPEVADKIKFFNGNVRNLQFIRSVMLGVDYFFQGPALKQVPLRDSFPMEAMITNVIDTDNILTATTEEDTECVICLSIDKSAYCINSIV